MRSATVAGLSLVLALGLAGTVPEPPAASAASAPVASVPAGTPASRSVHRPATVTVFTLNVAHTMGSAAAAADIRRALHLGGIGSFQEMAQRGDRGTLARIAKARGFGIYMPRGAGIATPVVWLRSRFALVSTASVRVHPREDGVTPARFINRVRLRDRRNGRVLTVVNTHALTGGSSHGRPGDPHLVGRLRKHIAMLREVMVRSFHRNENVVAMGDLNVNYLGDRRYRAAGFPTRELGGVVSFDMPLQPTMGHALLDYMMTFKDGSGLGLVRSRIVRGFHSDHDAVVATYRPVNLLATGPVFNNPHGDAGTRRRVLGRVVRAVSDTDPGASIRLATTRIADPTLTRRLVEAHDRGVSVRVIVGHHGPTAAERTLTAVLGRRTSEGSWLTRCTTSCQGPRGSQRAQFLLVGHTANVRNLVITAAAPLDRRETARWTDGYLASSRELYAGYRGLFGRMKDRTPTSDAVRRLGVFRAQYFPAAGDPVLRALHPVQCHGSRSPRTHHGRTTVRLVVGAWTGSRGVAIARRLAALSRHGCDVRAVLGPAVGPSVRRTLRSGPVPSRRAAISQATLVVDGHYGRDRNQQYVWTSSAGWTPGAAISEATTLRIPRARTARAYLAQFARIWQQR